MAFFKKDTPKYYGGTSGGFIPGNESNNTFDTEDYWAGGSYWDDKPQNTFSDYESLSNFAEQIGAPNPVKEKEEEGPGAWTRTMQVINTFPSLTAGFLAGATDKKEGNVLSTMGKYWSDVDGYGKLLRQWGLRGNDFESKVTRGTLGLAGDIFLDPLTYASFGGTAVLKIIARGGKPIYGTKIVRELNKETGEMVSKIIPVQHVVVPRGVKLLEDVKAGRLLSLTDELLAENKLLPEASRLPEKDIIAQAEALAQKDVEKILYDQIQKTGKLDKNAFDEAFLQTAGRKNIDELVKLAPTMISKGGIELFGKNMLGSKLFSETEIGKAFAKVYQESGMEGIVQAVKWPIGKLFNYGFQKSPLIMKLMERGDHNINAQLSKLFGKDWEDVFKSYGLTEEQKAEVVITALRRKDEMYKEIEQAQRESVLQFRNLPRLGPGIADMLESGKSAAVVNEALPGFVDEVIRPLQARVQQIARTIDMGIFDKKTVKSFKEGQKMIDVELKKFDALEKELELTSPEVKALIDLDRLKKKQAPHEYIQAMTEQERASGILMLKAAKEQLVARQIIRIKEKARALMTAQMAIQLTGDVDTAVKFLRKAGVLSTSEVFDILKVAKPTTKITTTKKQISKTSESIDAVVRIEKEIQETLSEMQTAALKLIDHYNIRTTVKKKWRESDKLVFGTEGQNKLADALWYGKNAIMPRVAKLTGISDDQLFTEYMPTLFKEHAIINGMARGRNLSPSAGIGKSSRYWDVDQIKDQLVLDPRQLTERIAKTAVMNNYKMDLISKVTKALGKPLDYFENERDAFAAGYRKFVVDDPVRKDVRASMENLEEATMREAGTPGTSQMNIVEGKRKVGGWVPKEVYKELADIWETKRTPAEIYKFLAGYDYALALTKAWLTGPFPAFHFQNVSSNAAQAMLQSGFGILDPSAFTLTYKMARAAEKGKLSVSAPTGEIGKFLQGLYNKVEISPEQAIEYLRTATIISNDGKVVNAYKLLKQIKRKYPEIFSGSQFSRSELGSRVPKSKLFQGKWNPLNLENKILTESREFGATFENQAKLAIVIDSWKKGMTIEKGMELAEEAIFNYSKITPFEREIMRRIIPFYTFAKKNAVYQTKKLLTAPAYTSTQFKLFNNLDNSLNEGLEVDDSGIPAYMRSGFGFGVGNVGKDGIYYNSLGLPIEEFLGRLSGEGGIVDSVIKSAFVQSSPMIKYPIEKYTGIDLFRGRPIVELDRPGVLLSMMGAMDNKVAKQLGEFIDLREDKNVPVYKNGQVIGYKTVYHADPAVLHFLRSLPFSRITGTASGLARYGQDSNPQGKDFSTRFITTMLYVFGIGQQQPDKEALKYFGDRAKYKELGEWLVRNGYDLKSYQTYYRERSAEQKALDELMRKEQ